jgi:hypothetical protein
MFAEQFAGAIERAPFSDLNDLAHKLWKAHAAGHLDDAEAQGFAERIEAKRPKRVATSGPPTSFRQIREPRKRQRSPDKAKSIARRRRLAKYAPLRPDTVEHFTTCELAVLYIVIDAIMRHGRCSLYIALIAARAGTCETKVRDALHKARNHALLYTNERRRRGQKSLANITWIANRRWGEWLRKVWDQRRRAWPSPEHDQASGCRNTRSTDDIFNQMAKPDVGIGPGRVCPTTTGGVGSTKRYELSRA